MSGKALKQKAASLPLSPQSGYSRLQKLVVAGFFDHPVSSEETVVRISETCGESWGTNYVHTYMKKFMAEGIIHAVKINGHRQNYWVLANVAKTDVLRALRKSKRARQTEDELFSSQVMRKLRKHFRQELEELQDNFGKNGNCTAFLLRKILEKLILIVFGKHGKQNLLEDAARPGGWKGLKEMTEIACREKMHGIPFVTPKTANEIKGVKFLGDTAAHNPLVGVDNRTIAPQMPYVITAFEELAKRL